MTLLDLPLQPLAALPLFCVLVACGGDTGPRIRETTQLQDTNDVVGP